MLGPLEIAVVLFTLALIFAVPMVILYAVAKSRNRSAHYVWWCLLGWLGFLIALAVILIQPPRDQAVEQ